MDDHSDDIGNDFEEFLRRDDRKDSLLMRSKQQLSENRRILSQLGVSASSSSDSRSSSSPNINMSADPAIPATNSWLKPKISGGASRQKISMNSLSSVLRPSPSVAVNSPALLRASSLLKADKVPSVVDEETVSVLSELGADLDLDNDTDEDKSEFFKRVEKDSDVVDYGKMNADLGEDSVDLGHVPDIDDEEVLEEYHDDFESAPVEDILPVEAEREPSPLKEHDEDDDLDSIRSSINDIENSLDMSDSEVLSQIDKIPLRGPAISASDMQKSSSRHSLTKSMSTNILRKSGSFRNSHENIVPDNEDVPPSIDARQAHRDDKQRQKEFEFLQQLVNEEKERSGVLAAELKVKNAELTKLTKDFQIIEAENIDLKKNSYQTKSLKAVDAKSEKNDKVVAEQEILIRGFTVENDKLVKQVKDLETRLKSRESEWSQEREELMNDLSLLKANRVNLGGKAPVEIEINTVEALRESLARKENELNSKIQQLEDATNGHGVEKSHLNASLEAARAELQAKMKAHQTQLKQKESQIHELKSQLLQKSKLASPSVSKLESKLKKPAVKVDSSKVKKLEAELFDCTVRLREFESQGAALKNQLEHSAAEFEQAKISLQEESSLEISNLRSEHVNVLKALHEKTRALEESQKANAALKAKIRADPEGAGQFAFIHQELEEKSALLREAQKKLEKLEGTDAALTQIRSIVEALRGDLANKTAESSSLSSQLNEKARECQRLALELEKKNAIVDHHKRQVQEMTVQASHVQDAKLDVRGEIEAMTKKVSILEVEKASLKQKLELAETMRVTLTDQFKKVIQESHTFTMPVNSERENQLVRTIDTQSSEIARLRQDIADIKLKSDEAEIKLATAKSEEKRLSDQLKRLEIDRMNMTTNKENDSRLANDDALTSKLRAENSKLRIQMDGFVKNGGPDSQMWQQIIEQISNLESRLHSRDQKMQTMIDGSASGDIHKETLDHTREQYQHQLRRKDEQIRTLRREMDELVELA